MIEYKMKECYFELDNTTETKDKLYQFFTDLGFRIIPKTAKNEFNRGETFTNDNGFTFDVIWFRNVSTIRFGTFGKAFIECSFDKIIGSLVPYSKHITLDFINGTIKTCSFSVSDDKGKENGKGGA